MNLLQTSSKPHSLSHPLVHIIIPQHTVFRYDIPKKEAKPQDIGKTREGLWSIFDGGVHTHLFCSVVVADQTGFWSSKKAFKPFERSRQRKSVSYAVRHPSYRFQQDEKIYCLSPSWLTPEQSSSRPSLVFPLLCQACFLFNKSALMSPISLTHWFPNFLTPVISFLNDTLSNPLRFTSLWFF